MQIAVIGDIHGCVKTLDILINEIFKKFQINEIYFIGDLIDRGPFSKDVIDLLLELPIKKDFMLGNHEDMMLDFLYNTKRYDDNIWLENGGIPTLQSFMGKAFTQVNYFHVNVKNIRNYFECYIDFFKSFKEYSVFEMGSKRFLISHCGIYNFDKPIDQQYDGLSEVYKLQKYPFLWARNCDFSKKRYYDYIIIHGHTPVCSLGLVNNVKVPYVNKSADGIISINIDTGCVYGYALSAIIIDSDGEVLFESIDCAD